MLTTQQLAEEVGGAVRGDGGRDVKNAQSLEKAGPGDLSYVADEKNLRRLRECRAGAVVVSRALVGLLPSDTESRTYILVDDAQGAFIRALQILRPQRPRPRIGISPQAYVSPSAQIGPDTNIHPGASIGEDVVIGGGCDIHPGVCIGPGCRIGDNATLHPNAVLYRDVILGDRVIVHASAAIGADGFGYRLVDGRHQRIPHFGTVRVEDDVEIGACTTIDRATIGETIVGQGTKIDNLVMIAHNCELGRHNAIVSQVGFAGSVTTGDYVVCAGHVGVADHVHLGQGCVLGSKAGVHKDVPAGATYIGTPAMPADEAMKAVMAQRKLPEMRKTLRALESQVAELSARLAEFTSNAPAANDAKSAA